MGVSKSGHPPKENKNMLGWSYKRDVTSLFEGEFLLLFWHNNFETSGDIKTFQRRRETEIKHGRVAMYATMGDWDQRVTKASWKVGMNCLDSAYVEMILWVCHTNGLQTLKTNPDLYLDVLSSLASQLFC